MMMRLFLAFGLALGLAACGSAPPQAAGSPASQSVSSASSRSSAAPSSAPSSAAARPAASGPSASGSAAPARPTFTNGTVKTIDSSKLALTDGKTFDVTANTAFTRLVSEPPSELKPGQFVGITAKPQPDGTLLASNVRVFLQASGNRPSASQFPMADGNLMTNAPIKNVDAGGMTVTLPGGDAKVKFGPGSTILRQMQGTAADVRPGAKVQVVSRGQMALAVAVNVTTA